MPHYLHFADGIVVEVSPNESDAEAALQKVGIANIISNAISESFSDSISKMLSININALQKALVDNHELPDQIEIEFGLKASAEISNIIVGKIGGDCNYSVKVIWKKP